VKVDGTPYRSIWLDRDGWSIRIIDQTKLPWSFEIARLTTPEEAAHAIRAMLVRGAPLIGVTAAYGLCLALRRDASDQALERAAEMLRATRPTAINLAWALERMLAKLRPAAPSARVELAYAEAAAIARRQKESKIKK
jgi:methylthioribose-1-phosphate isomerase